MVLSAPAPVVLDNLKPLGLGMSTPHLSAKTQAQSVLRLLRAFPGDWAQGFTPLCAENRKIPKNKDPIVRYCITSLPGHIEKGVFVAINETVFFESLFYYRHYVRSCICVFHLS